MLIECRHIMPRGVKCKAVALRDRPYCYFHEKLHDYTRDGLRDDKGPVCLPSIEDACGIQHALMQIMGSMVNGRIDSRDGVRLIYGLQVAIQALDRVPQTPPQEMVHATACDGIGVDIADQEASLNEPHAGCSACVNRFGCENVARQNKKSFRDHLDEAHDRPEPAESELEPGPLALPAIATDFPQGSHRQVFADGVVAVLPILPSGAEPSPDLFALVIEKKAEREANRDAAQDAAREADLEARINKFRTNKLEADRNARAEVLARMMADHEITIDDILALPEGSMEIPIPKRREEEPLRDLCSVGDS